MKANILFVDDNPGITSTLARLFYNSDYDVSTANSGEIGLVIMDKVNFSVVVADQNMPSMNGIHFLQQAHRKQPKAVMMMFSGDTNLAAKASALHELKIEKIILKPCFDDELSNYIDNAICMAEQKNRVQASCPIK